MTQAQPEIRIAGPEPAAHIIERDRYLRRNYILMVLDGACWFGGMAFINSTTLLPTMIHSLGGPNWLVALAPQSLALGFLLMPIFVAHRTEQLRRFKPLILITGAFQRLPLVAAGIMLLMAPRYPLAALIMVALAPVLSGLAGGLCITPWQQLFSHCIPPQRRSSLFAWRMASGCVVGLGAAAIARLVLHHYSQAQHVAFGILHFCTVLVLMGSYITFAAIHEITVDRPTRQIQIGLWSNLRTMPRLIASSPQLGLFLAARVFRSGLFILVPFLAIHARIVTDRPESYLGTLITAQMIGAILGNILSGWMGDRFGAKLPIVVGHAVYIALSAWAMGAGADWEFQAIFFLFGLSLNASDVGLSTLSLEVGPPEKRASSLSLMWLFNLPGMLLSAWAAKALWREGGSFAPICWATIVTVTISTVLLLIMPHPSPNGRPPVTVVK